MKKNILTAAVAALVATPFAASADTTLFGQFEGSVDFLSADSGANDSGIAASSNSSRIGIKGAHDLGGGLKGVYHMEWGVSGTGDETGKGKDSNGDSFTKGDLSQRNRFVGLAGGFGTVIIGRHDTPLKIVGRKADLFWSTQLGQNRSLTNPSDGGPGWDLRVNNVLAYISPKLGPVTVIAAYVTDHTLAGPSSPVVENNDNSAYSVLAMGNFGPIFAAVGYEAHDLASSTETESAARLTLSGNLGAVKLVGFYQAAKDQGFTAGNDRNVFGVGASFKAGSNTFKGQFYKADANKTKTKDGATLMAVGIDHAMSKSTSVYAQYAMLDNDTNGTFALGGAGHGSKTSPAAAGDTLSGVSLGIRVKF